MIENLTDIADQLISHGVSGVYEMQYEAIEAMISLWEYLGSDGGIQGPFTWTQIADWKRQGYFVEEHVVPMRRVLNVDEKLLRYREEPIQSDDTDAIPLDSAEEGNPKKRVRFEDPKPSTSSDLMADLELSDDEDGAESNAIVLSNEPSGTVSKVSIEKILELASKTSSFDSAGRGPWVMSDEVVDYDASILAGTNDQGVD